MDKLYKMAQGYCARYPRGVEPFQMVTRLLEECGEVASGLISGKAAASSAKNMVTRRKKL